ncbi:MAG: nickel pincer cofactor biosynthesis protein LarC [Acidimicrobiales bacterium]
MTTVTGRRGARTIAWFHCFAGIAGDMALGSLLDAGADLDEVRGLLERLPLAGWRLDVEPVLRGGIAATRVVVAVDDNVVVRTHAHIVGLIEEARLPERVAGRALATFACLADVEARLHRRPVDQVHFHEVGGHDTIVDIVGTAAALEVLGIDEVRASPVATGLGMVRAAHGMLPNPAPAVVALLDGVPTWGRNVAVELTTPTGAALLAALSSGYGPMPSMRVTGQGFGAGTRELEELPNCTQVVTGWSVERLGGTADGRGAGETPAAGTDGHPGVAVDVDTDAGHPVSLLEANLDDATGEQLAHAVEALLDAGAHDAWLTPVIMKKGRPGTVVHALCDPALVPLVRDVLRETTGTLGVRVTGTERWPALRSTESVWVDGQLVRVKVSTGRVKAEYDDVARVARRTGQPLREVAFRAEALWREERTRPGPAGLQVPTAVPEADADGGPGRHLLMPDRAPDESEDDPA